MPLPLQWTLRRAGWVTFLAWSMLAAGFACVVYASPLLAILLAVPAWRFRGAAGLVPGVPYGFLCINNDEQWEVRHPETRQRLSLHHVWSGGAWMTLRFERLPKSGNSGTVQYTVWKTCVSPEAWRQLRIAAHRHTMLSPHIASQEQP